MGRWGWVGLESEFVNARVSVSFVVPVMGFANRSVLRFTTPFLKSAEAAKANAIVAGSEETLISIDIPNSQVGSHPRRQGQGIARTAAGDEAVDNARLSRLGGVR